MLDDTAVAQHRQGALGVGCVPAHRFARAAGYAVERVEAERIRCFRHVEDQYALDPIEDRLTPALNSNLGRTGREGNTGAGPRPQPEAGCQALPNTRSKIVPTALVW